MSDADERERAQSLRCFVIGPIGNRLATIGTPERETYEEALRVMEEVIEPACAVHGLMPVRADSLSRAGEITEQIFRRLRDDDVVIADLTGANANVMYELGLRHTRPKLTIQIGEFGRLPFDVNTIRTVQFSRSAVGLINARDELARVLDAGLADDYDLVTATRVWCRTGEESESEGGMGLPEASVLDKGEYGQEDRGPLDIMADAEEQIEVLGPLMDEIGGCVERLGNLAETSTEDLNQSDAAGKGMRGRLQVTTRYAQGLGAIADDLEDLVARYVSTLTGVSEGTMVIIQRMEESPEELADGREYGMVTRRAARTTRDSMASTASMVATIGENAKLSRVLRAPSRRLMDAFNRLADVTSVVDEWDRRLQALGIPIPPDDWEPSDDEIPEPEPEPEPTATGRDQPGRTSAD